MLSTIFNRALDKLIEYMGVIGYLLILYCMVFGVTDVFLRYVLNSASQWIGATIQAAMVLIACVGGSYALKHGSFIKLDLFYDNFSARTKAICDVLTSSLTFAFLGVLIWEGTASAIMSIKFNEVTPTAVPVPIYPIKSAIPLAAFIVLLIVIKQFIEDIKTIIKKPQ
ncbi:TRAP transporter small permease [Halomonas piscis]|uniref:TRAP transporter small permease protein n=1 Tax=Halomonas piscis TaxID=3031727 RepID=A0ABY9YZM1_9GAMM|nr:TRAP transporter small permease [Halomonas piscis]WNK20324.1 TRAP transporter small permease [Halomonas piscis]